MGYRRVQRLTLLQQSLGGRITRLKLDEQPRIFRRHLGSLLAKLRDRDVRERVRVRTVVAACPRAALGRDPVGGRLGQRGVERLKILDHEGTGADPKRLAAIGFRVLLKMIFEDGFVHADLHPGNLFVTDDHRVAVLDVGLVGELDEQHRLGLARYFAAFAAGDGATMARLMSAMAPGTASPVDQQADYAAFQRDVDAFAKRYQGRKLGDVQISVVFFEMMDILRRHRVRANAEFTLVNIAIMVTEGIGKQLDPEVDLMATAAPFFARMSAELDPREGKA